MESYRLIASLSSVSKIFEVVIHKYMYTTVRSVITLYRHGFTRKRSTATNLLNFVEFACDAFSRGEQVDVIYTNFQ